MVDEPPRNLTFGPPLILIPMTIKIGEMYYPVFRRETEMAAKCPRCRRESTTATDSPHAFYCHWCKMEFDDEDDGTIGYGNPERFAERNERHQQRRGQQRQHRRPRR